MPDLTGTWEAGQECLLVEHDDATRRPREGGEVIRAMVTLVTGLYVRAVCLDGSLAGEAFQVWASSGWTAWDGWFKWRLLKPAEFQEGGGGDAVHGLPDA